MKSLPTVTIGIPAYNEEHRITKVLDAILQQKEVGWKLQEIFVMTDGCSDGTVAIVKKYRDRGIFLIEGKTRRGKTYRLSQLFQKAQGEIIVMFDADITMPDNETVSKLVTPYKQETVGMTAGDACPEKPYTFFQRCVQTSFDIFNASRFSHLGGNNLFCANGACLSIRANLAKMISFPAIVNEDSYLYFFCKQRGQSFIYVPSVKVSYKLPKTLRDYVRQVTRSSPTSVATELAPYFPSAFLHEETHRETSWYIRQVCKTLLRKPVETSAMILINVALLPLLRFAISHYQLSWFTATSTHEK